MEILEYLQSHWVDWFFAVCLAALGVGWKYMLNRLKDEHEKNKAIAEGVQSLLRESIVTNYNRYSDRGFCPIYAKESLKKVYHAYHDLGGNDVATDLYDKMLKMPTERGGDNEQ